MKIGAILPLSGKSAQYGKLIQEALELARSEVNSAGGIGGRPLEIIYEDDQANPRLAATAMQKLASSDHVPVVFGSWASSSVLAQAPIANKAKVVVMAEAVSPKIRDAGDFVFRIQPDGGIYMRHLVPFVRSELKLNSVSILYVNNDFGVDLAATFERLFVEQGGHVVGKHGFEQGEANLRSQLTVVAKEKPDAVFVASYLEAAQAVRQARELGITARFLAAATFENPEIVRIAGEAANDVIYPHHFDPDDQDPKVVQYQKKYREKYDHSSEGFAVLAYDGLHILANGLRKCGADGSCIRDYLYRLPPYDGVSGETRFDDHGDVLKPIMIKTVRDGRFVRYSTDKRD